MGDALVVLLNFLLQNVRVEQRRQIALLVLLRPAIVQFGQILVDLLLAIDAHEPTALIMTKVFTVDAAHGGVQR